MLHTAMSGLLGHRFFIASICDFSGAMDVEAIRTKNFLSNKKRV